MSNIDQITNELLGGNVDKAIKDLESQGLDFDSVTKGIDFGRKIVAEKFSINERDMRAVEFVFWVSYYIEKEIEDLIVSPQVQSGTSNEEILKIMLEDRSLGQKISLIEKMYPESESREMLKVFRKIQNLRNDIAHGRVQNLTYGGYSLSGAGQVKLLNHLASSMTSVKKVRNT